MYVIYTTTPDSQSTPPTGDTSSQYRMGPADTGAPFLIFWALVSIPQLFIKPGVRSIVFTTGLTGYCVGGMPVWGTGGSRLVQQHDRRMGAYRRNGECRPAGPSQFRSTTSARMQSLQMMLHPCPCRMQLHLLPGHQNVPLSGSGVVFYLQLL